MQLQPIPAHVTVNGLRVCMHGLHPLNHFGFPQGRRLLSFPLPILDPFSYFWSLQPPFSFFTSLVSYLPPFFSAGPKGALDVVKKSGELLQGEDDDRRWRLFLKQYHQWRDANLERLDKEGTEMVGGSSPSVTSVLFFLPAVLLYACGGIQISSDGRRLWESRSRRRW